MNRPPMLVPDPRAPGELPDGSGNSVIDPCRTAAPHANSAPERIRPIFHLLVLYPLASGADHEAGWVLETWQGGRRQASVPLTAWGAGAQAPPRTAQKAAVDAMDGPSGMVQGWRLCSSEHVPMFLARLRQDTPEAPAGTADQREDQREDQASSDLEGRHGPGRGSPVTETASGPEVGGA